MFDDGLHDIAGNPLGSPAPLVLVGLVGAKDAGDASHDGAAALEWPGLISPDDFLLVDIDESPLVLPHVDDAGGDLALKGAGADPLILPGLGDGTMPPDFALVLRGHGNHLPGEDRLPGSSVEQFWLERDDGFF